MNFEKINDLSHIAARLSGLTADGNKAVNKIVELISKELDAVEPDAQAEEIKALIASNDIKQANLNLLADLAIKLYVGFVGAGQVSRIGLEEMHNLAVGVRQEVQFQGEASSNGVAPGQLYQVATEIDPVAQVVDNLKHARAEVLRLVELRRQTSNQDGEVADAHAEACRSVMNFKEELIKAIDAQLK